MELALIIFAGVIALISGLAALDARTKKRQTGPSESARRLADAETEEREIRAEAVAEAHREIHEKATAPPAERRRHAVNVFRDLEK